MAAGRRKQKQRHAHRYQIRLILKRFKEMKQDNEIYNWVISMDTLIEQVITNISNIKRKG